MNCERELHFYLFVHTLYTFRYILHCLCVRNTLQQNIKDDVLKDESFYQKFWIIDEIICYQYIQELWYSLNLILFTRGGGRLRNNILWKHLFFLMQ